MEGAGSETLPALKIPFSGNVSSPVRGRPWHDSVSLPATPESMRAPSLSNNRLTNVAPKKGNQRLRGYGQRTLAYGTPHVVKQLYTGQLPTTYFNDICYGRRATPREFQYRSPVKDRERELWEPKYVSREQTNHKIAVEIQDARFRKQKLLEKSSVAKERVRRKKTEDALLKESETMSRGMRAYLDKLEKQTQNITKSRAKRMSRPIVEVN